MLVPNKHRQQKASEEKHYIVATTKSLIRARERERERQTDRGKGEKDREKKARDTEKDIRRQQ